jgi:hypothetical protein
MRLEVDDVCGRDGVAQPGRTGVAGWKRDDVCVGVLTRYLEPTQSTSPPTKAQAGQLRQARRWPATVRLMPTRRRIGQTTHLIIRHVLHNIVCDQMLMAAHVL